MESFHWDEHFTTGLTQVDEQHHNLVDMVNEFGDLLAQNTLEFKDIEVIFTKLADYAVNHFKDEEELMNKVGVDKRHIDHHISEHEQFLNEVTRMYADYSPQNTKTTKHLLDFLTHWLAYHILGLDQNMAEQIREIQSGKSPQDAYEKDVSKEDTAREALLVALNSLFAQVSQRNNELMELNKSLEKKVAQRTQELSDTNKHLKALSLTDSLTSLPNRRHAIIYLSQLWEDAVQTNSPLVCMMIDADHFKEVNDTYGHNAGDEVLQTVAKTLLHAFRNDDIVCRLGGDEFLVICPDTDLQGGMYIADQACKKVSELNLHTWCASISIGVASKSSDMDDYNALIKKADEGVYLSKKDSKNCARTAQLS